MLIFNCYFLICTFYYTNFNELNFILKSASCIGNENANQLGSDSNLSALNDDDGVCLQRQSLFSHMTEELCLAIRCHGNQQRTAFKRKCSKCKQIRKRFNQEAIQNAKLISQSSTTPTQLPHEPQPPVFEMKEFLTYENSI